MEKTDVIVVLGHRLLPDDTPSDDLKRRIDKAVEVWRETGAPMIMPCGGLMTASNCVMPNMPMLLIEAVPP